MTRLMGKLAGLVVLVILAAHVTGMDDDGHNFDDLIDSPDEREHWVDPLDLGFEKRKPNLKQAYSSRQQAQLVEILLDLENCRNTLRTLIEEKSQLSVTPSTCTGSSTQSIKRDLSNNNENDNSCPKRDIFLQRHVSILLKHLVFDGVSGAHIHAEIKLSTAQIATLRTFSSGSGGSAYDVDIILSNMILGSSAVKHPLMDKWQSFKDLSEEVKEPVLVLCTGFSLAFSILFIFRYFTIWKIFLVLIIVSVCWHWQHMYMDALSAKQAKLMQHRNIPPECSPNSMPWTSFFKSFVVTVDKCKEYHKALLVDPFYDVSPLMAFTDLLLNICFRPLRVFGKEFSEMVNEVNSRVPVLLSAPVLVALLCMIAFILILISGYKIRLPLLGEISPGRSINCSLETDIQEIKQLLKQGNRDSVDFRSHTSESNYLMQTQSTGFNRPPALTKQQSCVEEILCSFTKPREQDEPGYQTQPESTNINVAESRSSEEPTSKEEVRTQIEESGKRNDLLTEIKLKRFPSDESESGKRGLTEVKLRKSLSEELDSGNTDERLVHPRTPELVQHSSRTPTKLRSPICKLDNTSLFNQETDSYSTSSTSREVSSSVTRVDRWSDNFEEDTEILDENLLLSSPSSRAYLSRVEEILNLDQDPS